MIPKPKIGREPDDFEVAEGKVAIGYLSGTDVSAHFLRSLLDLKEADRQAGAESEGRVGGRLDHPNFYVWTRSGANVSKGRNVMVAKFLAMRDPAPEWLLVVDADMVFDADALEKLVQAADAAERPIVGGLCIAFGKDASDPASEKGALMSTAFLEGPPIDGIDAPTFKVLRSAEVKRRTLMQVIGTGAAFLLVHRNVLVDIAAGIRQQFPWFREVVVPDSRLDVAWEDRNDYWISEDLYFCMVAQQAGYPIFVHTGVEVRHVKPIVLDETLWRQYGRAVTPA